MRISSITLMAVGLSLSGVVSVAQAYPSINASASLLSAFNDTSNFWRSQTTFGFNLYNSPTDPDLYINAINFVPGPGYDANIGLAAPATTTYATGFGSYTLGTPLAPDTLMYLYDAQSRWGDVPASVANGTYDFNLEIMGGYDAAASDVLANIPYQIQIAAGIRVSASAAAAPITIAAGESANVNMTVTNNDPTQTFIATTWFVGDFSNGTDSLSFAWAGDWFNKTLAPGDSLTDTTGIRTADSTTPLGIYMGTVGVVGGLVNGDNMYILADPAPTITVVPEPATLSLLALSGLALLRRRRQQACLN